MHLTLLQSLSSHKDIFCDVNFSGVIFDWREIECFDSIIHVLFPKEENEQIKFLKLGSSVSQNRTVAG